MIISEITTNLAANDEISKLSASKEKIYNSKPSIEESFAKAERTNIAPRTIRDAFFKDYSL